MIIQIFKAVSSDYKDLFFLAPYLSPAKLYEAIPNVVSLQKASYCKLDFTSTLVCFWVEVESPFKP